MSPVLLGDPVRRPRKYVVLLRKDRLQWQEHVLRHGLQQCFEEIFRREVLLPGFARLRAPEESVRRHIQAMGGREDSGGCAVSYTHLTLPTICSV
eukprot:1629839-Prorocentrum_lima.AAC.1